MNKQEQIKSYWQRINKIEEKISNLKDRGLDYSNEMRKRKSMLNNVKRIENGTE